MPEQDSPPESRNSPTSTLTRETVHEWVGTAFETIARRFPQLASLIEQHRSTIVSLINIHCPQGADSCEGLSNIERQVDGYFLLAQEDTQSGIESELVDAEMREYGNITGQIRSFFAGRTIIQVPRDQPRVAESAQEEEAKTSEVVQVDALPFCKFQEVWNGVIGERGSIWTPSSKEANAAFNTYLGGQRIMVADEQFGDSLGFLYMDLPRGGIDNWMYLEHFRIVLVALLQQMEKTLEGGCEAYAREYRERYLDGVETLEGMAGSQYSLSAAQEIGTPVIWKSCLHKICQDAHERYSIDIEAEEALVVFREGHVGQLFEREYTSLFRREVELLRQMPPCISRDRFTELERQLQVDLEQCNDLLSTHVVPHLGSAVASIKHKKGAADAKRGKIFTRHAKLIEITAREGGSGDPGMNTSLKTAIDNAKAENVPNANIDRAIKKGTGELKGEQTVAVTYEAYGPGGAALIIECLTDNRNRTLANVKSTIEKRGGKWAESGAVMWMFEKKGVVIASSSEPLSEEVELSLIDAGAEDIEITDGTIGVTTAASDWPKVRDALKEAGYEVETAGLKYVAKQEAEIADANTAKKLMEFTEALEEDEDVAEVHTNANISDEVAAQM